MDCATGINRFEQVLHRLAVGGWQCRQHGSDIGGLGWDGVLSSAGDAFAKLCDLTFRAHLRHEIRNGCVALGLQVAQEVIQLLADACDFGVCLLAELSNNFIPVGDVALHNRCSRSR